MVEWVLLAGVAAAAFLFSCLGTRLLIPLLRRGAVLDQPNARSSHTVPTPRGAGIALVGAVLAIWFGLTAAGRVERILLVIAVAALVLAIVSWIDDLKGLSPSVRLAAQVLAVAAWMATSPPGAVFQGWLPPMLDRAAAGLLWVWSINLFNFMDGIDGIAGSEAAAIGVGLVLFASAGATRDPDLALLAASIAAAALGFLVWNWSPARIFMGDVGSVPLGYLLGFLLLGAASAGAWRIALILPLYFLADATITLLRRLLRGERVWQAHREHFYQQAVRRGLSHSAVVWRVIAANVALIGLGWFAENGGAVAMLAAAVFVVVALLVNLGMGFRAAD
jgi:UDP-N-acetylmuramyl pentapeptide phosphotransferase/UDP-N-acetylglucosamine-1-phosphate transferase